MAQPYCLAMVLCDAAHQDPGTGKKTLLGTFSTVFSKEYPARITFAVYFAITDVDVGDYELGFRVVDSEHLFDDESDPLFDKKLASHSISPLGVCEGVLMLEGFEIPSPGVYHCELLIGNEVLMSRRLVALEPPTSD
jgi:hypothetical protein